MSEVVFFSSDLDFLEGMDEPGELIWTGEGWSFADVTVATPCARDKEFDGRDAK